jgi:hypothetical protein
MIISKIETFPLRIPFKPGGSSDAAAWGDKDLLAADSLLVKVTTDQGCKAGARPSVSAVTSAKLAIDELIAPLCLGRDALQIALLMLEVQKRLHIFGRNSPLTLASPRWTLRFGTSRARPLVRRSTGFWAGRY